MNSQTNNPLKNQHRARKRFGQNFLIDKALIAELVDAINPLPEQDLLEIGPGQGALTLPLLKRCGALTVVELDRDLVARLQQAKVSLAEQGQQLEVISADALRFDFSEFARPGTTPGKETGITPETSVGDRKIRVLGNLPYNISTPLMFHLLNHAECIEDMHFMLQHEVIRRMTASPGNKSYGRLSVMLQWQCRIQALVAVPPTAFSPQPKVDSGFVRLQPLPLTPEQRSLGPKLNAVVTAAFAMRRKTIRNSLAKWISSDALESLDINPGQRAEALSIDDFCQIARQANETID